MAEPERPGTRLRRARYAKGWSQQEVGRRSGLSQSLISELENGTKDDTTGRLWLRLARVLGVDVNWLLTGEDYHGRRPAGDAVMGVATSPDGQTQCPSRKKDPA